MYGIGFVNLYALQSLLLLQLKHLRDSMIKLVLSDMDETLKRANEPLVPKRTLKAITALKEAGIDSPSMVLMHAICKRLSVARVKWFTVRAHLLPSECSPQRRLSESFRLSQGTRIPTWHILVKDQRSLRLMYPSGLHG